MLKLSIHRHCATSLIKLLLLSICLISSSASICADSSDLLIGEITLRDLQQPAFASWFEKNYKDYHPAPNVMEKLRPLMDDVTIMLFMGTWCHDSQREVPRLMKLLKLVEFDASNLRIIGLSTNKTSSFGIEQVFNIKRTPTIVLFHDGTDIGRVVERPQTTLEQDMLAIIEGRDVKVANDN